MVKHKVNEGLFFPAVCVASFCFVPFAILELILMILEDFLVGFLLFSITIAIYVGIVIAIKFGIQKSKNYYVIDQETIKQYTYLKKETIQTTIPLSQIVSVDYYRSSSIVAWIICFVCGVMPRSLFVTYMNEAGNEKTVLLGYVHKKEAKALFENHGLVLY